MELSATGKNSVQQLAVNRTFIRDITPWNTTPLNWGGEKRFKRVLLVFPDYKGGYAVQLRPPAGLGYIAESLEHHGVDYDVLDMAVGYNENDLFEKLKYFRPDLVGMSMMSLMYYRHYEILQMIKQFDPSITIVAGGPHLSCFRNRALEECSAIDYGVVKEGEGPLLDLVFGKDPAEIRGLIHRQDGKIVFNGERPYEKDFGVFPWPKYKKFPLERYITEEMGIETSRGCPQQCTFCPVIPSIGTKYRRRSNESAYEEIEYWYEKGYRQISILDDNFSLVRPRVMEFCKTLQEKSFKNLEFNCNNGVRADRVDLEMLQQMYAAGFRYLAFGVEGGNDKILSLMKKGEGMKEIERAIQWAVEAKFKVTLFFIVGNPGETPRDVEDTFNLALKYPVFDARFYNLIPFPGSELFDWVVENNYFVKDPKHYLNQSSQWDYEPVFTTPEFSAEDRIAYLYKARQVRRDVRYKAMKKELQKLGLLTPLVANMLVKDWFYDMLRKNPYFRKVLKRSFMKITSTGGNAISLASTGNTNEDYFA